MGSAISVRRSVGGAAGRTALAATAALAAILALGGAPVRAAEPQLASPSILFMWQQPIDFGGFGIPNEPGGIAANGSHLGLGNDRFGYNFLNAEFLGSSTHDNGGTDVFTGGVTRPGIPSTTRSLGFQIQDVYDASPLLSLPPDQTLVFGAFFTYRNDNSVDGPLPGLTTGSAGNTMLDDYRVDGGVAYNIDRSYIVGRFGRDFGFGNELSTSTGGIGKFHLRGLNADLAIGHSFQLLAPSIGGPGLDLDVSGHGGYQDASTNSFIDSAGAAFGEQRFSSGVVGAKARLIASFPIGNWLLKPFIGPTFDHYPGFTQTVDLPAVIGLPAAEGSVLESRTFWGGEVGFRLVRVDGFEISVSGFYQANSNVRDGGGLIKLTLPFRVPAGS